jgi:hypothetical protein
MQTPVVIQTVHQLSIPVSRRGDGHPVSSLGIFIQVLPGWLSATVVAGLSNPLATGTIRRWVLKKVTKLPSLFRRVEQEIVLQFERPI